MQIIAIKTVLNDNYRLVLINVSVISKMNKLVVIVLLFCLNNVFGAGIVDNQDKKDETVENYDQRWDRSNKNGGDWPDNKEQRYPGIWTGSDRNGRGRFDDDERYSLNRDYYFSDYDRLSGQSERYSDYENDQRVRYDNGWNANRWQGVRIGVNGNIGNRFNGNRLDRNGLRGQGDVRTQLLLNAGLRGGLGLNAGLQDALGLNANLLARLGLNAGLSLGAAAGLSLGAGLRVGLDLSLGGGELTRFKDIYSQK